MDTPSTPGPEEQEVENQDAFTWGDDSFDSVEEAEKGIAQSIASNLDNENQGTVEMGGKTYVIEITVHLIDSAEASEEGEELPSEGELESPEPPAEGAIEGPAVESRSAARNLVDRLLS